MSKIWFDQELEEAEYNPVLARRYYQSVAMNGRRIAVNNRRKARLQAVICSPIGFEDVAAEGFELLKWADIHERVSDAIFEHLDMFVRSSIQPARCTCHDAPSSTA